MTLPFSFRKKLPPAEQTGFDTYEGLRNMVLTLDPKKSFGIDRSDSAPVVGVLMETGHDKATATLVGLVDGTASLYLSTGGGVIGGAFHEGPANAAKQLVADAAPYVGNFVRVGVYPLPEVGHTSFTLLTFDGTFSYTVPEPELREKRHPLWPLYYRGHQLMTELRLMQEHGEAGQS